MYVSDIRKITIWQAVMSVMISGKNPQYLVKLVGKLCWKIEYCIGSNVSVVTNMSHVPAVGQIHTVHLLVGMAEK